VTRPGSPDVPQPFCTRCRATAVVGLGDAHSTLEWYRCTTCGHIWGAAPQTPTEWNARPAPTDVIRSIHNPCTSSGIVAAMLGLTRTVGTRLIQLSLKIICP